MVATALAAEGLPCAFASAALLSAPAIDGTATAAATIIHRVNDPIV